MPVRSIGEFGIDVLGDVFIQNPQPGQILVFDGLNWTNVYPDNPLIFYLDETVFGSGLFTLSTTPAGGVELDDSVSAGAATEVSVRIEGYVSSELGITDIPSGLWEHHSWCYTNNNSGVNVLQQQVCRRFAGAGTVALTGAGTNRTATVSDGTPFLNSDDESVNHHLGGKLETPTQTFEITGYSSSSVVTVATLAGYVNETGVAYKVHRHLFTSVTDGINSTLAAAPDEKVSADTPGAFSGFDPTDRLSAFYYAYHTGTGNRTIHYLHNGTTHYSHIHTPLTA